MDIPSAVKNYFQYLLDSFGGEIQYIGDYQGEGAYQFCFPEDSFTGFPIVVLYQEETEQVREVSGEKWLDTIRL